jgi:exopolyphosphatase/guanosine-5'-triphosphate,3'-diphosphate pyrophosphatase
MSQSDPRSLAALDLGSNSFHMIVARQVRDEVRVLDRLRDPVRLAGGIGDDKRINDESISRALSCLERFAQRLRELSPDHVRAVGTNTLRSAKDIGGGSTEVIVGDGFDIVRGHSLYMGCVSFTRRFFDEGNISARRFREAETAAAKELSPVRREIRKLGWKQALGASGTIRAVGTVLKENEWTDGRVTPEGLARIREALVEAKTPDRLNLVGLRSDRVPVFAGGVAILAALFHNLGIEEMRVAPGALREGVLYDLIGRLDHEDVRERTIQRFVSQFHVDVAQADRVDRTAAKLLSKLKHSFGDERGRAKRILHWASQLHELGLDVAYSRYQKHSAYVIENAFMPGFSADDQRAVSRIVRFHRRSLKHVCFDDLPESSIPFVRRLTAIFRLAVIFHRSRTSAPVPHIEVTDDWSMLLIRLDPAWAGDHPLTVADLHDEVRVVAGLGVTLKVEI